MKEEALKLADEIDNFLKEEEQLPWGTKQVYLDMASTMIRRLVEELDCSESYIKQYQLEKQSEPIAWLRNGNVDWVQYPMDMSKPVPLYTTPQTKPLSDEEIKEVEQQVDKQYAEDLIYRQDEWVYLFARAIEERHGIK